MTSDSLLTIGQFQIYGLRDGFFSLDGGAMFGVVPKTLWEKIYPADQNNRIHLALNSLLIRTENIKILCETGIGTHLDEKVQESQIAHMPVIQYDRQSHAGLQYLELAKEIINE